MYGRKPNLVVYPLLEWNKIIFLFSKNAQDLIYKSNLYRNNTDETSELNQNSIYDDKVVNDEFQSRFPTSAGWIVRVKIQNVQDLLDQEKKVNYKTQFVDELKGIDIKKSDDVFLIYMHLDSVSVSKEDAASKKEIGAGFILGYAGVSGSTASGGRAPHS